MLPLPDAPVTPRVVKVPPPPTFRGAPDCLRATFSCLDQFDKSRGNSLSRRAGLRYEKDVHLFLRGVWKERYRPHPWVQFFTPEGRRYCCPDGLVINVAGDHVIVVEAKLSHTSDAWWQLRKLYQPVLQVLYGPTVKIDVLEITRNYDPGTPFPEKVELLSDLGDVWFLGGKFGVFKWKK